MYLKRIRDNDHVYDSVILSNYKLKHFVFILLFYVVIS